MSNQHHGLQSAMKLLPCVSSSLQMVLLGYVLWMPWCHGLSTAPAMKLYFVLWGAKTQYSHKGIACTLTHGNSWRSSFVLGAQTAPGLQFRAWCGKKIAHTDTHIYIYICIQMFVQAKFLPRSSPNCANTLAWKRMPLLEASSWKNLFVLSLERNMRKPVSAWFFFWELSSLQLENQFQLGTCSS